MILRINKSLYSFRIKHSILYILYLLQGREQVPLCPSLRVVVTIVDVSSSARKLHGDRRMHYEEGKLRAFEKKRTRQPIFIRLRESAGERRQV